MVSISKCLNIYWKVNIVGNSILKISIVFNALLKTWRTKKVLFDMQAYGNASNDCEIGPRYWTEEQDEGVVGVVEVVVKVIVVIVVVMEVSVVDGRIITHWMWWWWWWLMCGVGRRGKDGMCMVYLLISLPFSSFLPAALYYFFYNNGVALFFLSSLSFLSLLYECLSS